MKKIELNAKELDVLERQVRGEINDWVLPVEEINILNKLITDAEALLDDLDAYDELDGDLMRWYYDKYRSQSDVQ
nr:MAG TPA: hypothetical protein [Caudoviricetes sp.]